MNGLAFTLILGVVSGIILIVLVQVWPTRYRWSNTISLTEGDESGRPIYNARLGRSERRIWRRRRNPIDVTFNARIAVKGIGPNPNADKLVPIPVDREWRPVIGVGVLTVLFPEYCDPRDLRWFPKHVVEKRAAGTLRLEDLLQVGDAKLRIYAFAYRPYIGTRLVLRGRYTLGDIVPGLYSDGEVERTPDGKAPRRPEVFPPRRFVTDKPPNPNASWSIGKWSVQVRRGH